MRRCNVAVSDGYSGITANPALGYAATSLCAMAYRILSEDAGSLRCRHLLTRRAKTREVGQKLIGNHPLVGRLCRPQQHGNEQQSVARQQPGRA